MSKTKKNAEAVNAFEKALLDALKAQAIKADDVQALIVKAGFAVSQAEHDEAKPVDAKAAALSALSAFLPDHATASAGTLADAFGKYWQAIAPTQGEGQGTKFVSYYIGQKLLNGEVVKKADVVKYVQTANAPHSENYASDGHYNKIKKLLRDAGFKLAGTQGSFWLA
jgi:hypothetical protein